MKIRLLDRVWRLLWVKKLDRGDGGTCDQPDARQKAIRILADLEPREELRLLIHESLHACHWWADEEWVDSVSDDIARLLWRCGWRPTKKHRSR